MILQKSCQHSLDPQSSEYMLEDAGSGRRYNALRMISFMLAVVGLRNLTDLSPIALRWIRASLPDALAESAPTMLSCVRMPSAATLQRYQILVDAALLKFNTRNHCQQCCFGWWMHPPGMGLIGC